MMTDVQIFIGALFVTALVRHVVSRQLLNRLYPRITANSRAFQRAKERFAADDSLSEMERHKLVSETYKAERLEGHPFAVLAASHLLMWGFTMAAVWAASVHVGGVFGAPIWWVAVAFHTVKLVAVVLDGWRSDDEEYAPLGRGTKAGCAAIAGLAVLVPFTVLYAIAPAGVITFVVMYWCVSWVLWRVFPYAKGDDLPKIATLFL